jgi:uncharacterized membrane protein
LYAIGADLVAIFVLTFAVYFPRHHRRDLVAAYLTVNVGVLAAATVLGSASIGVGLGLGLFGVLSIIRLRSDEIAQVDLAYYFASLALGLLAGLGGAVGPITYALMVLVVAVLVVGDHPRLLRRYRQQSIQLDVAYTDEEALWAHLEILLKARVVYVGIKHLDLVNDTTLAEVRYVASAAAPRREPSPARQRAGAA